jgi:hypothetical protein
MLGISVLCKVTLPPDLVEFVLIIIRIDVLHDGADWQSDKYVLVNAL